MARAIYKVFCGYSYHLFSWLYIGKLEKAPLLSEWITEKDFSSFLSHSPEDFVKNSIQRLWMWVSGLVNMWYGTPVDTGQINFEDLLPTLELLQIVFK